MSVLSRPTHNRITCRQTQPSQRGELAGRRKRVWTMPVTFACGRDCGGRVWGGGESWAVGWGEEAGGTRQCWNLVALACVRVVRSTLTASILATAFSELIMWCIWEWSSTSTSGGANRAPHQLRAQTYIISLSGCGPSSPQIYWEWCTKHSHSIFYNAEVWFGLELMNIRVLIIWKIKYKVACLVTILKICANLDFQIANLKSLKSNP